MNRWLSVLEREATTAIQNGELPHGRDSQDIAFTLNALAIGANCHYQLHHDPRALDRARHAMATVRTSR
jgi:Tetracyclin repressor-like, C-terminal domain